MKISFTLDIRRTKSLIQEIDNQTLTLVRAMGNMTSWYLSTTCISAFDSCMHKSHPWYLFPNRINILHHVLFFLSINKTYYICCMHTLIHIISFHFVIIRMYDGCPKLHQYLLCLSYENNELFSETDRIRECVIQEFLNTFPLSFLCRICHRRMKFFLLLFSQQITSRILSKIFLTLIDHSYNLLAVLKIAVSLVSW